MTPDPETLLVFVFVTFVLGGAAALAAGRAVARGWHTFARVPLYMLPLTGAVGFLHYALFGVSAIPAGAVADAIVQMFDSPGAGLVALARALSVAALIFVILCGFGYTAWRATRAGQMARQYGFAVRRHGFFGWRAAA